jgi:hypothetical protein
MTMAANDYKNQTGTSNKVIAELLIIGCSCQLKGWWDYHLTEYQWLDIIQFIQTYEDQTLILSPHGNIIQYAISTLILTISLHFIRGTSHLNDENVKLLSNNRCKKLNEF